MNLLDKFRTAYRRVDNYCFHKYQYLYNYNSSFRRVVGWLFLTKNPFKPSVEMSPAYNRYLNDLKEKGICKIETEFAHLAPYLEAEYLGIAEQDLAKKDAKMVEKNAKSEDMTTINIELSLEDRKLWDLFLNKDLCALLYNYYGRQFYYRNFPIITVTEYEEGTAKDPTAMFHLDSGLRQISFIYLLNDVDESTTHMQYVAGTHKTKHHPEMDRTKFSEEELLKGEIIPLTGKKGTLFVFDAGNGFHRKFCVPGSVRKMMHINLTTGYYNSRNFRKISSSTYAAANDFAPHVRNSLKKIASQ